MKEIITNIHIHSCYSDGRKTHSEIADDAIACGLDAIIITDHNIYVNGIDGYYFRDDKKVLVIVGEEIHDTNRIPQKNHLLGIGINHSHTRFAKSPQGLIDSLNAVNGLSFIAHAYDPALLIFGEENLSWEDWSITGFTGLEIWNNLSELKIRTQKLLRVIFFAFFPAFLAKEPPIQIRTIWDALLTKGSRIVGIGGSDAHTLSYHFGSFRKIIFSYDYHFKTINNHIMPEKPLTNDALIDTEIILSAINKGRLFIANDSIKPTRGFRFFASLNGIDLLMGDEMTFRKGILLTAILPAEAQCILLKDGLPILTVKSTKQIEYLIESPGIYRLECYRRHLFRRRGWIFSNPIYIR